LHIENAEQRPFVEPGITHNSKNDMYTVIRERLHFLNLDFSVMDWSRSGMPSSVYFSILKSLSDIRSLCITANQGSFMQDEEDLYPFGSTSSMEPTPSMKATSFLYSGTAQIKICSNLILPVFTSIILSSGPSSSL
jgi:hypothetical protein